MHAPGCRIGRGESVQTLTNGVNVIRYGRKLRLTGTNAYSDEGNVEHVLIDSGAKPDYRRATATHASVTLRVVRF